MTQYRTMDEIDGQLDACYDDDGVDITNRWPGMSYEQGVDAALRWVTCQSDEPPVEPE